MEKIPALEGFVPRYYGTPQIPHANIMQPIILSKHDGMKLESVISEQPLQVLLNSKKLLTHIIQTLHESGLYHGKLTSKNILVSNEQGHEMTVFNFCHAALKKDLKRLEAQDMEDVDLCCTVEIFGKFITAKVCGLVGIFFRYYNLQIQGSRSGYRSTSKFTQWPPS